DGSTLLFSTYLGGDGGDYGMSIAVGGDGSCYITGETSSSFPMVNAYDSSYGGARDIFISKLSADGSTLLFSTYLGGRGIDRGCSIAVDSHGNSYITGFTGSDNFPIVNAIESNYGGESDVFVSKLSADGSTLLFSTYLGGDGGDYGMSIAVGSDGSCYITGFTGSDDFPTVNTTESNHRGGYTDAFVSRLSADGSTLLFSTYLGGESYDHGYSIAVGSDGSCYITGNTESSDFPVVNAIDDSFGGSHNVFISVFQLVCISTPKIKYPTAGTIANGTITIEWIAASDFFNHSITYSVYYSPDEGATWIRLASGLTATVYQWNTTAVPNGFSYLIKVVATCSEGLSAEDTSDEPFTIQNVAFTDSTTRASFTFTPGMTSFVLLMAFVAMMVVRKGRKR
ncbi:MAG: SBBP repeat-containing protein, partial [Candidatus Odinarchaeota archaeon]